MSKVFLCFLPTFVVDVLSSLSLMEMATPFDSDLEQRKVASCLVVLVSSALILSLLEMRDFSSSFRWFIGKKLSCLGKSFFSFVNSYTNTNPVSISSTQGGISGGAPNRPPKSILRKHSRFDLEDECYRPKSVSHHDRVDILAHKVVLGANPVGFLDAEGNEMWRGNGLAVSLGDLESRFEISSRVYEDWSRRQGQSKLTWEETRCMLGLSLQDAFHITRERLQDYNRHRSASRARIPIHEQVKADWFMKERKSLSSSKRVASQSSPSLIQSVPASTSTSTSSHPSSSSHSSRSSDSSHPVFHTPPPPEDDDDDLLLPPTLAHPSRG